MHRAMAEGTKKQSRQSPKRSNEKSAEDEDGAAAEGVGGVPIGHLGGQFFGGEPMSEQAGAGWVAHALEDAVEGPEEAEEEEGGAESEADVEERGDGQGEGHHDACVGAVGEDSAAEFADAVDQAVEGEDDADAAGVEVKLLDEDGGGNGKIFADEVEGAVTGGAPEEDAWTAVGVGFLNLVRVGDGLGGARGAEEAGEPVMLRGCSGGGNGDVGHAGSLGFGGYPREEELDRRKGKASRGIKRANGWSV